MKDIIMTTLNLQQIKKEHTHIYNDFKEIIEQFQSFFKSNLFIHFITNCSLDDKEEWENILASTIVISQNIESQKALINDLIHYNIYSNIFFNKVLGKYLLPETKNILDKLIYDQ